jgi:hypothetical protein
MYIYCHIYSNQKLQMSKLKKHKIKYRLKYIILSSTYYYKEERRKYWVSTITNLLIGIPCITFPFWLCWSIYCQWSKVYSAAIAAWRDIKNQVQDLAGTPWNSEHLVQVALMSSHIVIQELYDSKIEKLLCCGVLEWQHNAMTVVPLLDSYSICKK